MTALATPQHKARKLPGGKHLKALVARQQRQQTPHIDSWEAYEARRLALIAKGRIGPFQAIELLASRSELVVKDLRARIEALEADLAGKATAKAPAPKPLRLKLMRAISDATVRPIIDAIEGARGREIKLCVMSPGGGVYPARRLADAIAKHGAVDTHAMVECDSAATLIFAAGRRRSALKNCTFLFHRPSLSGRDAQTPGEARRIEQVAKDMAGFIAKHAGGKPSAFLKLMTQAGNTIDPGQASMLGLINDVVRRPHVPRKGKGR